MGARPNRGDIHSRRGGANPASTGGGERLYLNHGSTRQFDADATQGRLANLLSDRRFHGLRLSEHAISTRR
jgi:hypothetical protein